MEGTDLGALQHLLKHLAERICAHVLLKDEQHHLGLPALDVDEERRVLQRGRPAPTVARVQGGKHAVVRRAHLRRRTVRDKGTSAVPYGAPQRYIRCDVQWSTEVYPLYGAVYNRGRSNVLFIYACMTAILYNM